MFFTIIVVFITILSSTSLTAARIDTSSSIDGEPFKNITHCANSHHVSPNNIHVLMMGSEKFLESYELQSRSFREYCKLHGYNFHTRDPDIVYKTVGTIRSDGGKFHVVSSKPLFIHCKSLEGSRYQLSYNYCFQPFLDYMRELFHKYGCEAKWLFYVDADTVMVDLTRSLESVISFANQQYYPKPTVVVSGGSGGGGGEGCVVMLMYIIICKYYTVYNA